MGPMKITVTDAVVISANIAVVFDFVANLENDRLWRTEISATTTNRKQGLEAVGVEESFLSKRVPCHRQTLACVAYQKNAQVTYQTMPEAQFFLRSSRQVESVSPTETRVVYHLDFDKNLVKHGLGFSLPTLLVRLVAKRDMKKYLTQLKRHIEEEQ